MLTTKRAKTLDDLRALPPETRAELIGGDIFMSPTPNLRHQRIVANLYRSLDAHVRSRRLGEVFLSPIDVILAPDAVAEPDIVFVSSARRSILRQWIEGVPDLAIEVLSPSTNVRDRVVKRDLYARHGVPEYWIVDPDARTVEILKLSGPAYALHAVFESGDTITSPVLPDLRLAVEAVFG
jgi:Uma2 family endonuclease